MTLSWGDTAWQVMGEVRAECLAKSMNPAEIAKAIDDAYPFGERAMYPYKAWLAARKRFFAEHGLPRKGGKTQAEMMNDLVGQMQAKRHWI
jgi:hypothetical protein